MSGRRSVLERPALFVPAPSNTGQANHGGVPREMFFIAPGVAVIGFILSTFVALMINAIFGVFYYRLIFVAPLLAAFIASTWLMKKTKKRRDFIHVLKESFQFKG